MPVPNLGILTVDDVVYVGFEGRMYGQRILNTFYYQVSETDGIMTRWDAYEKLNEAFAVALGLKELFLNCLSADYTLEKIRYQYVNPSRMVYRSFQVNETGALLGDTETANLCASIERRVGTVDAHAVGRLQLAGLPSNTTAAGLILPGHLAVLNTLAAFMSFVILAGDTFETAWQPVLFSKVTGQPAVINPIIEAFPHPQVRTMSRRTVGRGE